MKLASLKDGRDGRLVVVSKDLSHYADAGRVPPALQGALDEWEKVVARLARIGRRAGERRGRFAGLRSPTMRGASAARLPVARWLGLRQSCRAGTQGARRRGAGVVLERSADVPRRFRRDAGCL